MIDIHIPKMGMSTVEVDIVRVRIKVGDVVQPSTIVMEDRVGEGKLRDRGGATQGQCARSLVPPRATKAKVGDVIARLKA